MPNSLIWRRSKTLIRLEIHLTFSKHFHRLIKRFSQSTNSKYQMSSIPKLVQKKITIINSQCWENRCLSSTSRAPSWNSLLTTSKIVMSLIWSSSSTWWSRSRTRMSIFGIYNICSTKSFLLVIHWVKWSTRRAGGTWPFLQIIARRKHKIMQHQSSSSTVVNWASFKIFTQSLRKSLKTSRQRWKRRSPK